jgi:hypothetical protein
MTNLTKLLVVSAIVLALVMGFTYAYAGDTIKECQQADGSIMYTNKPKLGCTDLILPELAGTAHTREYSPMPVVPDAVAEVPPIHGPGLHGTDFKLSGSNDPTSVCELYHKWIALQMRTQGGFQHNSVGDTQSRFGYTTIFGSGYPPAGC